MIVGKRKPFEEILQQIQGRGKVLVLGCRTCVEVCMAGGEKEAEILAEELTLWTKKEGVDLEVTHRSVERQCDPEYLEEVRELAGQYDVVLSMACGAGVQFCAETFHGIHVKPAINTNFVGVTQETGLWSERCQLCGNCVVGDFGGICPVARCSKSLLNGPCGGSQDGKCEVDPELDCGWQLIYDRLSELGELDKIEEVRPAKDWRSSRDGGPRKVVREDVRL